MLQLQIKISNPIWFRYQLKRNLILTPLLFLLWSIEQQLNLVGMKTKVEIQILIRPRSRISTRFQSKTKIMESFQIKLQRTKTCLEYRWTAEIKVRPQVLPDKLFRILMNSVDWIWILDITKGQFVLEKKVFPQAVKNLNRWMMMIVRCPLKMKWMVL